MKKLFTLISVVAVAGAVSTASAIDRTGNIGLGYQQAFMGENLGTSLGSWSVKYGMASNMKVQFAFGFDKITKDAADDMFNVGLGLEYDLVENENSDFYTGLKIGLLWNKTSAAEYLLRFEVPLGFEWSFAGLPELGFTADVGLLMDYATQNTKFMRLSTIGGGFNWGVHYYF